ncbi:AAA domain (dynein-related subfamily) [Arthrobacter sp. cf158]|uniref:McrB family protein n=1 Tax=Arthrobacter sp. cf158 TaxID=1761744 RepID=UPI0008965E8E|nr:AAA family ATPase [Arthrobacter sp. cf158]SDW99390.1 AAA domain (dynein-related subfamily) [Arthrobacter sp. cf158]
MELALETVRVLRRFKNAVLEGPPGTGKSHVVSAVVAAWENETGRKLVGNGRGNYAITLHPSTTYEEFVEGLRYDDAKSSFVRKDGFLREVIANASADHASDYLILIDELNRANVPKVFGDLLLTMESSKRTTWDGSNWIGGMEVTLPYSGKLFSVPSNVYLLGTMNTSDRSIAPLDSALRRRFGFIRVEPLVGEALRQRIAETDGSDAVERVERSIDQLTNLNEALRRCLGPNAMLGHSYLFGVAATEGSVADANDPLAVVREAASQPNVVGGLWLEVSKMWGFNHNQLDLPDQTPSRRGLVESFYPMASGGTPATVRSGPGSQDSFDIAVAGKLFVGNTIEYNKGGSNVRLKYQGRTALDEGILSAVPDDGMEQHIHVWLRRDDDTFELILLDRTASVLAALQSVSSGAAGWHARTPGSGGRAYGEIDIATLAASQTPGPTVDEDAEWMIWRYAILPQLIDTATQVGATDLLAKETRNAWLEAANANDVADRWESFDRFLASLSLAITEEGYGLTRGLTVVDIPVGAASEFVAPETSDEPDAEDADDGDQ